MAFPGATAVFGDCLPTFVGFVFGRGTLTPSVWVVWMLGNSSSTLVGLIVEDETDEYRISQSGIARNGSASHAVRGTETAQERSYL